LFCAGCSHVYKYTSFSKTARGFLNLTGPHARPGCHAYLCLISVFPVTRRQCS
jgi:hypothetical protein